MQAREPPARVADEFCHAGRLEGEVVIGLGNFGWGLKFNFGDSWAWESDWRANDDSYVDSCDFVFYTGHANQDGWQLATGDGFLHYTEVGSFPATPGDHYGQLLLNWLIIAACGPHQSTHFRATGTTNAIDRWRGVFDGLHTFMGYGAVTYDNTTEGGRDVQLASSGWTIFNAWFRTALEVQMATNGWPEPDGPTIIVTAMFAHNGDGAILNDRIWGTGQTYPDARAPDQVLMFLWSGT